MNDHRRFWRDPIPEGEPNPIATWIVKRIYRGALIVAFIYFGGWLAHLVVTIAVAGWNS